MQTQAAPLLEATSWVASSEGHQLALRIVEPQGRAHRRAVLALHGLFSDGRFFLNAVQQGPGQYFLQLGHRLIVGEQRGHGRSRWPAGPRRWNWSFDDLVRHDLPALIEAAARIEGAPVFVVAHSIAGYALLAALGCRPELQRHVAGVCIASSAVNDYSEMGLRKRIAFPLCAGLARALGRFPARALRVGVADEPPALMGQFVQWARQASFASIDGGVDYARALHAVKVPVLAIVGAADRFHASRHRGRQLLERLGSSQRQFIEAGPAEGFSRPFGHVDVLRGRTAAAEVLPRIAQWLESLEPAQRALRHG